MEGFIGEIRLFAGNYAPRWWALCEGQLLSISDNTALFSILGTTYGGDGISTFGLPDLRGAAAMHPSTTVRLGGAGPAIAGTSATKSLALNYIICLNGTSPSRS